MPAQAVHQGVQVHPARPLRQHQHLAPRPLIGGQALRGGAAGGDPGGGLPGARHHLGGEGGAQAGVTDDPDGVPPPGQAAGEPGVVGDHRAHPHQNGPAPVAQGLDVGPGLLPRHPLGGPGVGGDLAVQSHGVFHDDVGPPGLDVFEKDPVQPVTLCSEDALLHLHAVVP